MSSAQFHCTQYSGAGATNIYQLRPMDGGLALQPPPLPEKSNSGSCVSDHLTKSARRTPPNLRMPITDPQGYSRPPEPIPPLPPAIPERRRPHNTALPQSSLHPGTAKEVIVSESMSLTQFIERYSKDLPLQIKVLRGYCGSTSRLTISADDTYSIHFVKRVKVVHIVDVHNQQYSVPINSCIEFGVAFDFKTGGRYGGGSSSGLKLSMVSDVMQLVPLPKVICVLKAWKGDDDKTSVIENEVLVVKQVHKSKFKNKRSLKVYSVTCKMEKSLPEECSANFSTQPYHNRILIGDLVEHSPEPFPCTAVIYLNAEMYTNPRTSSYAQDIPEELLSKTVSMQDIVVETSLVSSAVLLEDTSRLDGFTEDDKGKFIDIPLEGGLLQIEVALVDIQHTEKLYDDTRNIYEKYNPSRVKAVRDVASNRVYSAQSFFYSAVRTGCETLGVELDEPSSIYEPIRPRLLDRTHAPPSTYCSYDAVNVFPLSLSSISSAQSVSPTKHSGAHKWNKNPVNQTLTSSNDRSIATGPPLPAKQREAKINSCVEHQTLHSNLHRNSLKENIHCVDSAKVVKNPLAILSKDDYQNVSAKKMDDSAIWGSETDSSYDDIDIQLLRGNGGSSNNTEYAGVYSTSASNVTRCISNFDVKLSSYDNRLGFLEAQLKSSNGSHVIAIKEMEQIKSLLDRVSTKVKSLEEELHALKGSTAVSTKVITNKPPFISSVVLNEGSYDKNVSTLDANTKYLTTLSVANVVSLLEAMDLSQYTEAFAREQISGEILMELDEEILKTELGITSKLHRIRIMKVAGGQHSAFNLLSGLDPYSVT